MATQPQFIQKRLARKTSSITRLTDEYKRQVNAITGEYEKSFADYTAKQKEVMDPYSSLVAQYQQQYKGYEESLAGYRQRLADYTNRLEDINKNPLEVIPTDQYKVSRLIRFGTSINMGGKSYSIGDGSQASDLPEGYTFENNVLYKKREPGTFTEKAPAAPTAPEAPTIQEFDTSKFEAQRAELGAGLKRELGERRAAKLGAVSRKQVRPMLQGS